jgi:serine/threonine protein kinase
LKKISFLVDLGSSTALKCANILLLTHEVITLWYRPPEILLGGNYNYSVDIWSMGCTIYEMLTGEVLFKGRSKEKQFIEIFKILGTPNEINWPEFKNLSKYKSLPPHYQPKLGILAESSPDLKWLNFILSCLTYNPDDRPSTFNLLTKSLFDSIRSECLPPRLTCLDGRISNADI